MSADNRGFTWARVGVLFPFVAAMACNALIGATDPTARGADASVACVLNSDCETGELCIFRVCSPPCRTDADCATHARCLATQAGTACVDNSVATCEANLPCPMGSECKSGSCRNVCQSAADCLLSQVCVGGACVGTDPSHDTGFDAGPEPVEAGPPLDAPSDQGVDQTTDQAADQTADQRADQTVGPDGTDAIAETAAGDGTGGGDGPVGDAGSSSDAGPTPEGGCGDTSSDVHNCGSCSHDCSTLPNVGSTGLGCNAGKCVYQCAAGHADCGDGGAGCATDLSVSPNCGACGVACSGGTPVCAPSTSSPGGYACASGCPSTAPTLCGSACVDLTGDDNNCKACSMACTGGAHCVSSACQCTGGTHLCGGACVANDTNACGSSCMKCTVPTGGTAACNGTVCAQACNAAGQSPCNDVCVDETMDTSNCGMCGNACTGGTPYCVNGTCVAPCGPTNCAGCCNPTTQVCTLYASQTGTSCGHGGAQCHSCAVGTSTPACSTTNGTCASTIIGQIGTYSDVIDLDTDGTNVYFVDASNEQIGQASAYSIGPTTTLSGVLSALVSVAWNPAAGIVMFDAQSGSNTVLYKATPSSAASAMVVATVSGAPTTNGLAVSSLGSVAVLTEGSTSGVPQVCTVAGSCSPLGTITSTLLEGITWPANQQPFVADYNGGKIDNWAPSCGCYSMVTTTAPSSITNDGTYLYWYEGSGTVQVMRMAIGGTTATPLGSLGDNNQVQNLTTDGKYVYWSGVVGGVAGIYYLPVNGGTPNLLTTVPEGMPVRAHKENTTGQMVVYYGDITNATVDKVIAPP